MLALCSATRAGGGERPGPPALRLALLSAPLPCPSTAAERPAPATKPLRERSRRWQPRARGERQRPAALVPRGREPLVRGRPGRAAAAGYKMAPRREPGGSVIRTRDRRGGGAGLAARGVARRAGSCAASAARPRPSGLVRTGQASACPRVPGGQVARRDGWEPSLGGRERAGRRAVAMAARPVLRCPRPGGHVRGGHQRDSLSALRPVREALPCRSLPGKVEDVRLESLLSGS